MFLALCVPGVQICDLGSIKQEGDPAWHQCILARMTVVAEVLSGGPTPSVGSTHGQRGVPARFPLRAHSAVGHFSCCLATQPDSLDLLSILWAGTYPLLFIKFLFHFN